MADTNPLWLAATAIISPILVGVMKELLSARKVKADAHIASFTGIEGRNEFLEGQIDKLRKEADDREKVWQTRYDDLVKRYNEEREARVKLEALVGARALMDEQAGKPAITVTPKNITPQG